MVSGEAAAVQRHGQLSVRECRLSQPFAPQPASEGSYSGKVVDFTDDGMVGVCADGRWGDTQPIKRPRPIPLFMQCSVPAIQQENLRIYPSCQRQVAAGAEFCSPMDESKIFRLGILLTIPTPPAVLQTLAHRWWERESG
jgi:hypothetical protein